MTVLLERDDQILLLEELLGGARRGSGSVVFVAGEAGAGKSSLVSAFAARASGDALVLTGYCDPLATPRALGPLHDMAAAPESGIADVLHRDDIAAVLGALLDRLRAARLADGDVDAMVEAIETFDRLGARPAANWARARLRSSGARWIPRGPRVETRANPAGLTARQLDVVRLMLAGRSNADIAGELYVSKKTVEHHVSAIYLKLGVATRAEAIVVAADLLGSAAQT